MTATSQSHAAAGHPRTLSELPIGRVGMWWFLASEIMVFGGLLGAYILSRIAHGGWTEEMTHLNSTIAAINTLVLVTSSLAIVQAHAAADAGDQKRTQRYLFITAALGLVFLGNKAYEYSTEIHHGFTPATSTFWSYYYGMTGLHGIHVFAGIVWIFALAVAVGRPSWHAIRQRVEYAGLYWHFVDVVWIFLFPLLYLS
jgi:heme/copper-type cytochrome/quinol oxidase subunit 3